MGKEFLLLRYHPYQIHELIFNLLLHEQLLMQQTVPGLEKQVFPF